MKDIPKFELPYIEPYVTTLDKAVRITLNAMIDHYNTYIVAQNIEDKE